MNPKPPLDLGIKRLKRQIAGLPKSQRNEIVRLYKAKAYSEVEKIRKDFNHKIIEKQVEQMEKEGVLNGDNQ